MTDPGFNQPTPQFGTAEYVGTLGGDHCQFCHQPIAGAYYRANGAMACSGCAEKMRGELAEDTHAAFVRAVVFGIGAAILGMILYATFAIVTGIVIGYAALAVGWIVGKAMIAGSKGVGGRRYQIAAVLLTYAAVSTAAIPVWIHYAGKNKQVQQHQAGDAKGESDSSQASAPQPRPNLVAALGTKLLIGLASPFLELSGDPFGGLIGLFILFIGMKFAWRFTAGRPIEIFGPFEDSLQPSP
jgi:hypothetical protein